MIKKLLLLILFSVTLTVATAKDVYPFNSPAKRAQFEDLISQLRCLVCQNENLAASDAKLAEDLRGEIYTMVQQGKSEQEIKSYLVTRYGEFILFKPVISPRTYILWFAPVAFLLGGFTVLGLTIRKYRHAR